MTVLRAFRVRIDPQRTEAYETFERDNGVPMVAGQQGCIRAGFGRVVEEGQATYVFFSLWDSQDSLDAALATPEWKRAGQRLSALGAVQGETRVEHWEVVAMGQGPARR